MKYERGAVDEWAGDSQWRGRRGDLARLQAQDSSGWGSDRLGVPSVDRACDADVGSNIPPGAITVEVSARVRGDKMPDVATTHSV